MMPGVGRFWKLTEQGQARNNRPVGRGTGLPLPPPAGGRDGGWFLVDSGVQIPNHLRHRDFEHLADAEERGDGDRPTRFNLLPVPRREPVENHVLLRVATLLAKPPYFRAKGLEEFLLIHALVCSLLRAG